MLYETGNNKNNPWEDVEKIIFLTDMKLVLIVKKRKMALKKSWTSLGNTLNFLHT